MGASTLQGSERNDAPWGIARADMGYDLAN